jgi:hypothetical protein
MKGFLFVLFLCSVRAFRLSFHSFFQRTRIKNCRNCCRLTEQDRKCLVISKAGDPEINTDVVVECAMKTFKTFNISKSLQEMLLRDFTVILPRYLPCEESEVVRLYQFEHLSLQVLHNVNDYYSGTYKNTFWHQNSDQVLIYYPIHDDSLTKQDVNCTMDSLLCSVSIRGDPVLSFPFYDKIKPDASFWSFEEDSSGRRYFALDLEKQLPQHNWKTIISGLPTEEIEILDKRSNLLLMLYQQYRLVYNSNQTSVFNTNSMKDEISSLKLPGKPLTDMLLDTVVVEAFVKHYINASKLLHETDQIQDYLVECKEEEDAKDERVLALAIEQGYQPKNASMDVNTAGDAELSPTNDQKSVDIEQDEAATSPDSDENEKEMEKKIHTLSSEDKEKSLLDLLKEMKKISKKQ